MNQQQQEKENKIMKDIEKKTEKIIMKAIATGKICKYNRSEYIYRKKNGKCRFIAKYYEFWYKLIRI